MKKKSKKMKKEKEKQKKEGQKQKRKITKNSASSSTRTKDARKETSATSHMTKGAKHKKLPMKKKAREERRKRSKQVSKRKRQEEETRARRRGKKKTKRKKTTRLKGEKKEQQVEQDETDTVKPAASTQDMTLGKSRTATTKEKQKIRLAVEKDEGQRRSDWRREEEEAVKKHEYVSDKDAKKGKRKKGANTQKKEKEKKAKKPGKGKKKGKKHKEKGQQPRKKENPHTGNTSKEEGNRKAGRKTGEESRPKCGAKDNLGSAQNLFKRGQKKEEMQMHGPAATGNTLEEKGKKTKGEKINKLRKLKFKTDNTRGKTKNTDKPGQGMKRAERRNPHTGNTWEKKGKKGNWKGRKERGHSDPKKDNTRADTRSLRKLEYKTQARTTELRNQAEWTILTTGLLIRELKGIGRGQGAWIWRISLGMGWMTWAKGMNNNEERGERQNEAQRREEEHLMKEEEERNTNLHLQPDNEKQAQEAQERGDEASEEQADNMMEEGSTSYSYTDSRASIEGHTGNTEEEDTEGSEQYDTDTDTNTNTLYSDDEVAMTYWDEHRTGFPPVDVLEEKKQCYICGRTSTARVGICKGCGFEVREMTRKEEEEEKKEETHTYIKMKVTHGTTGKPNAGIAINSRWNYWVRTNTCKECGITVKKPEKNADTTKWDKTLPQLWQNKVGRFTKRDGAPFRETSGEGTSDNREIIQMRETDTTEGYVTTVGAGPRDRLHWPEEYHRVVEKATCTECMEKKFGRAKCDRCKGIIEVGIHARWYDFPEIMETRKTGQTKQNMEQKRERICCLECSFYLGHERWIPCRMEEHEPDENGITKPISTQTVHWMLAITKTDKQVRVNGYMETNWIIRPTRRAKTEEPQECARKCKERETQQEEEGHDKTLQVWKGVRKVCDKCTKMVIANTCMEGWYAQPRRYGSIWIAMDIADMLDLTHTCAERYYRGMSGLSLEIWIRVKKQEKGKTREKCPHALKAAELREEEQRIRHEAKHKTRIARGRRNPPIEEEEKKIRKTYNDEKMVNERFGTKGYGASKTATDQTQCVGRIEKWEERRKRMESLREKNKQRRKQEQQMEKAKEKETNKPSTSYQTKTTLRQEQEEEEREIKRTRREHKHKPHQHKQKEEKKYQPKQKKEKKRQNEKKIRKHRHMAHQHIGEEEENLNSPMSSETSKLEEEKQEEKDNKKTQRIERREDSQQQENYSFYTEKLRKRKSMEEKIQEQKQKEKRQTKPKTGKREKKAEEKKRKEMQLQEKEKQNRVQRTRAKEGAKKIIWIEMCCGTAPFTKYMLNEYRGEDCRAILIDIRPANELHLQVQIDSEYIHFWQGDIRYINKKTIEKIVKGLLDSEIEELHLIQCSFPCQTYSYASIGSGLPHRTTNGEPKGMVAQQATKDLYKLLKTLNKLRKRNKKMCMLIENPQKGSFGVSWEVVGAIAKGEWRMYTASHCASWDSKLDGPATAKDQTMWPEKPTTYLAVNLPEDFEPKTCAKQGCEMKNEDGRHIAQIIRGDYTTDMYIVPENRRSMIPQGQIRDIMKAYEKHIIKIDGTHEWCVVCGKGDRKKDHKKKEDKTGNKKEEKKGMREDENQELERILICDEEGCRNTQHTDCSHMPNTGTGNWYCNGCQIIHNGVHKHHRHSPRIRRAHKHERREKKHTHAPKKNMIQMEEMERRQAESEGARKWLQEHSSGITKGYTKGKTKTIKDRQAQSAAARRWIWQEKYKREQRETNGQTECICGGIIHIWKQGEQIWIECKGECDEEPVSERRKEPTAIRPKQQLTNREIEVQARKTNKTQPETKTRKIKTHPKHRYGPDKYAQYEKRKGEDPEEIADEMFDYDRAEQETGQEIGKNTVERQIQRQEKRQHIHSPGWQERKTHEEMKKKETKRRKRKGTRHRQGP